MALSLVLLSASILDLHTSCDNTGYACEGCPAYDGCDHRLDVEDDEN